MKIPIRLKKERLSLLSWIVIPILITWISVNYLVGALKQPDWETKLVTDNNQLTLQAPAQKFHWKNTGLVTFWLDDAWLSQYTVAFPILENQDYTASIAVPTRLIGSDAYLSWPQVKRLQFKGWEISSHSRNHSCSGDKMQPKEAESEIIGAKSDLAAEGITASTYVTPCGVDSPAINEIIKKNYLALRTSSEGLNSLPLKNPYNINTLAIDNTTTIDEINSWIQQAKDSHSWLILLFHQISDENSQFSITPGQFTKVVTAVKQSGLPVVLPSQVLEMIIDN